MPMKGHSKILIFGAGVIGCIYAARFAGAGYDVTVYARGDRLRVLREKGLLYDEGGKVSRANVVVIDKLERNLKYDYAFVAVRYEQITDALTQIKNIDCGSIVTMVNNPSGYGKWENILGKGRLIAAFPGAGGRIENGVLHYQLTPRVIQATTFGETSGKYTVRAEDLKRIFRSSKIPYSFSKNMDAWQKTHLAMVTALANGIYYDGGDNYTTAKNKEAIQLITCQLKRNFNALKKLDIPITPLKMRALHICPGCIMNLALKVIFNTRFAFDVISSHANKAKNEMRQLDRDLQAFLDEKLSGASTV